jgi:hypothetical protein
LANTALCGSAVWEAYHNNQTKQIRIHVLQLQGFFSIVLMAVVDADCNFVFADAGAQGRISDGGVFKNTVLARLLEDGALNLPKAKPLPNTDGQFDIPY